MSKILFWSPYHGLGQTSNVHASAMVMSAQYRKPVLIMQTHFTKNNLEAPLVGSNVDDKIDEDSKIFQGIGLDAAITFANMTKLDRRLLESCCLTFEDLPLFLLPGTETKNKETFDRDIGKSVGRMIRDADECIKGMILIDSNSGDNELSFHLMEVADLIVINLTQRRYVLDQFFKEYGDKFINHKKVFYLFGDYDDNSSYNINNCRKRYRKYIKNHNSGVIPYCTMYMDAQNESQVVNFMKAGLHGSSRSEQDRLQAFFRKSLSSRKNMTNETEYFFHRTRLAVEKMFELLKVPIHKERRRA